MSTELRVVIPHLSNKKLGVRNREIWVNEDGLTDALTPEEHSRLTSIGYPCWSEFTTELPPPDPEALVVLTPVELDRVKAAGFRLVPLLEEIQIEEVPPSEEDLAAKGDVGIYNAQIWSEELPEGDFKDLDEEWLDMDEAERLETIAEVETGSEGLEPVLRQLFDLETNHLNSPVVLERLNLAISRIAPKQTVESINEAIVKQSAAAGEKARPPAAKKRG